MTKLKKIAADFERRAVKCEQQLKGVDGVQTAGWKHATQQATARDTWRKAAKVLRKRAKA